MCKARIFINSKKISEILRLDYNGINVNVKDLEIEAVIFMIAIQFFNGKSQFNSQEAEKLFHYSKKLQTLMND